MTWQQCVFSFFLHCSISMSMDMGWCGGWPQNCLHMLGEYLETYMDAWDEESRWYLAIHAMSQIRINTNQILLNSSFHPFYFSTITFPLGNQFAITLCTGIGDCWGYKSCVIFLFFTTSTDSWILLWIKTQLGRNYHLPEDTQI